RITKGRLPALKSPVCGFTWPSDTKAVDKDLTYRVGCHKADNRKQQDNQKNAPDRSPWRKFDERQNSRQLVAVRIFDAHLSKEGFHEILKRVGFCGLLHELLTIRTDVLDAWFGYKIVRHISWRRNIDALAHHAPAATGGKLSIFG